LGYVGAGERARQPIVRRLPYPSAVRSGGKRVVELVGWGVVGGTGIVMLTQAVAWSGSRTLAVAQSLTPYLTIAMAPVAVAALGGRRFTMALTASAVGIGGLVLAIPVVFPPALPAVADGATGLRIASLNLLYLNDEASIAQVADDLRDRDADVIVFVEYTAAHRRVLQASDLAGDYHQVERSGPGATGIAVWSKTPAVLGDRSDSTDRTLEVTVETDDGPIRVLAVHAHTPTADFEIWKRDLAHFDELGRTGDVPTVMIGDFNASFWHPSFRALLDDGFTDAHIALGHGFSASWPNDASFPPFVRLDHALTTDSLVPTGVEDFDITGSDHRGLIVTVAPAR
jgi:endonuclease/exonuclease/phosphatase (EEP) superfamily protein YafD